MTSDGVKLILCAQIYLIGELRIMLKCYICLRHLAECMVSYIDLTGEISGFGWMSIYIKPWGGYWSSNACQWC